MQRYLRQPPRIKILEALSAVADGRLQKLGKGMYLVRSSDGTRTYRVYVDAEKGIAYSDDNGTRYRGYIGYPIIAALMEEGVLPYNERLGEALRGIPWRKLNESLKKYALVEKEIKKIAGEKGISPEEIDAFVEEVMKMLRGLRLRKLQQPPLELLAASHGEETQ